MPTRLFETLINSLKIKNVTAPLNGGEKLYRIQQSLGGGWTKQYQKWKLDNPQIDWKTQEAKWNKK